MKLERPPALVIRELPTAHALQAHLLETENGKIPAIYLNVNYLDTLKGEVKDEKFVFDEETMAVIMDAGVEEISHLVRKSTAWLNRPERKQQENEDYEKIVADLGKKIDPTSDEYQEIIGRYFSSPEEYMGLVWRNKVAQKNYPWSRIAEKVAAIYERAAEIKKEKAQIERQKVNA